MPSWLRYHSTKISWIKRFWEYYILKAYQVYTTLHFTNYCCVSLNYNVSSDTWYFLFFETVLNGALFSSYLEGGILILNYQAAVKLTLLSISFHRSTNQHYSSFELFNINEFLFNDNKSNFFKNSIRTEKHTQLRLIQTQDKSAS